MPGCDRSDIASVPYCYFTVKELVAVKVDVTGKHFIGFGDGKQFTPIDVLGFEDG